jgi:PAS domain S-box-containing protein
MWRVELARPVPLDAPEPEQIDRIFRDGYIAECNDAMARLAGARNADELVGSQFSALIPETDERIRGELLDAVRSRYGSATVFTTPTGDDGKKLYRLRTQCGIVENNELRRIWGTTRDITELKMAELAVEASERRFREVLENIHLPALMLNQTGAITFCNHALLGIANCAGGLLGRNWLDLIPDVRERATWSVLLSDKFAAEESRFHFEGVVHAQDDPPRLIVWDAIVLRDESGDTVGLAAIGSDLTDHRMLESRLAQAEKLEAIGRLAGGIAHDLNNSLTLIMGYVESALGQIERAGPLQNTLAGVQSAAADCAVLAEQLLAIGRRQQLRPELLNLNSVIAAQREMIERIIGPDINLVQEPDPAIGLIWFDPVQLRRILTNLAANSRDAMPGGGALTIATGNARVDSPADTSVTAPADYVRLTIADTGCGLSDEVKRHLFEPFFTTKPPGKGAGLGLTTVYAIVSQSGGQISVRSPGIGTVIEILFPRVQGVPETPKTSVP